MRQRHHSRIARIAIASATDDLHALLIQRRVEELGHFCRVIEVDSLAGSGGLSWSPRSGVIPVRGGEVVEVCDLDVVWWRRAQLPQIAAATLPNQAQMELVSNDCRAALTGTLLTQFAGVWVNDPSSALLAENKLLQLKIAADAGFRIPETLVSQDPAHIREFCGRRQAVVKAVMGSARAGLLTRPVTDEDLLDDAGLRISPAIYQELVTGTRHLRVQCFGDTMITVMITAAQLDWRAHLDSDFRVWSLPENISTRLRKVLDTLNLRMGIVDLKLTDDNEFVWLEVNQQGQFLFLEGLTGIGLTDAFSRFLIDEAGTPAC